MKKFLMLCVCSCLLPAHAAPSGWARIQPSIDYAAHDRWQKSLPRAVSDIPSAASAVRGQDVFLYLRLDSYGRDRQNRTSVTYDLRIVSPSGKVFLDRENIPALTEPAGESAPALAETVVTIRFGEKDEAGIYRISASVRDLMRDKESTARAAIELVESKRAEGFADDDAFNRWVLRYHENPQPWRLPAALSYYLSSVLSADSGTYPRVLGFGVGVLSQNRYLLPELCTAYLSADERGKGFYRSVLRYFDDDAAVQNMLKSLSKEELAQCERIRKSPHIYTRDKLFDARQLGALWGSFSASGSYGDFTAAVSPLALRGTNPVLYNAAYWSLKTEVRQSGLVRGYCRYARVREDLSAPVKRDLDAIMAENERKK